MKKIILAISIGLLSSIAVSGTFDTGIKTRYGELAVKDNGTVIWQGKKIVTNKMLGLPKDTFAWTDEARLYQVGESDVQVISYSLRNKDIRLVLVSIHPDKKAVVIKDKQLNSYTNDFSYFTDDNKLLIFKEKNMWIFDGNTIKKEKIVTKGKVIPVDFCARLYSLSTEYQQYEYSDNRIMGSDGYSDFVYERIQKYKGFNKKKFTELVKNGKTLPFSQFKTDICSIKKS
ncbi:hypothetical protein [Suttonella ornithocola]|uniref:Uncharacterized protein n=1 Tax=Suttonella ornithocola TaxID=279832 RepID=A0A380MWN8_9GAMM|nr:hypothetical protein [Suttonella ornithocola]SUO96698.1 Uncharacterised protein [Suttonella ornithocola]